MRPPDDAARVGVRERLDETLFLEAGAGSGKTTCLAARFVALVEAGVEADRIAAITFTEKAAGELADRIRTQLQKRADSEVCRRALGGLDRAAICTLHAFAQRVLIENPIEAGLPPRFTVLDEIGSQLDFEARWEAFFDRVLEDPELEQPLRLLTASGASQEHLHQIATQFEDNWDLVAERARPERTPVPDIDVTDLLAEVDRVVSLGRDECRDASDRLSLRIADVATWANSLRDAADDDTRLERLSSMPSVAVGNVGRQGNWPDIAAVRRELAAVGERRDDLRRRVQEACLQRIAEEIAGFTVTAAEERRAAGELEFHDLLVLARAVLRDPRHGPAVRRRLADRYQRLLLDEFQDTDPIQIELAVLIASDDPAAGQRPWEDVVTEPGRLFFVGDPKQSIYRFRRADIAMFLKASRAFGSRREQLTANFRSAEPVLRWVNRTFGQLIVGEGESQPDYVPLAATRPPAARGPAVSMTGLLPHPPTWRADDLREAEAAGVAAAVRRAVSDGWTVSGRPLGPGGSGGSSGSGGPPGSGGSSGSGGSPRSDGDGESWRPATWSDVAILIPARTSLRALERALEQAGVPYRAETSSLVYGTGEVRDLLMVARAVEDPTDSLAVVAALRTTAFGCGDDDLYDWRHTYRGLWDHQRRLPEGAPADHVVAGGLAWLGALHRERLWLSPSQVLERIVRERRLMEVAFAHARPRDLWRRLRFVVDQCRAWEEAGGTTLREYLRWVKLQAAEGSRVVETVLPESDDEAVRILTVHGAKGLEFPITVMSGMTTQLDPRRRGVQVLFPPGGRWALHIKEGLETSEFSEHLPIEERMDRFERLRLLYVAATRACDHLIVSVHRKDGNGQASTTAAALLYQFGWSPGLVEAVDPSQPEHPAAAASSDGGGVPDGAMPPLPSVDEWQVLWSAALQEASRPVAVSATRLAEEAAREAEAEVLDGVLKDPRDIDLPPWQKGRYGSAVGRAVHGVLQSVDLDTGEGVAEEAAAQAAAEGVFGRESVIEKLCRCALASELVRTAARSAHWREVYVGVPHGDLVLEGYIDLLFRSDDGLVIVDYKTDSVRDDADLLAKVARYRVQLDAYRLAAAEATGERVAAAWLLFLRPDGTAMAAEIPPPPPRAAPPVPSAPVTNSF